MENFDQIEIFSLIANKLRDISLICRPTVTVVFVYYSTLLNLQKLLSTSKICLFSWVLLLHVDAICSVTFIINIKYFCANAYNIDLYQQYIRNTAYNIVRTHSTCLHSYILK